MMTIAGTLLLWIGIALFLLGSFAFLIAAFRESILWGLLVLFVSPCGLIFLVLHWSRAKNSFFLMLWGWGFVLASALAFHTQLPWPLG